MIVHEDDIVAAKPMGLLESTQRREAADMGLDLNDPEQAEALSTSTGDGFVRQGTYPRH